MKKSLIFFLMLWSSIFMYAQHLSITGKVTDKQGESIIGASVLVKGTSNGVITDLNGVFNMKDVPSDGVLTVSYIGYKDVEVKINPSQTSYSITLEEDNQMLDEVVVVGFGTQKKVNLTGAVA